MAISVVGVDLSKSVFQISLADTKHHVVDRKRLSRAQFHRFLAQTEPVRLVMEACGTSHYWGRTAQSLGHEVKLLHAKYVKAYVRRTKTDSADADALILADNDKSLHPIPVKPEELQALQGLHKIREQWKRARVARICEAGRYWLSSASLPQRESGVLGGSSRWLQNKFRCFYNQLCWISSRKLAN